MSVKKLITGMIRNAIGENDAGMYEEELNLLLFEGQ
jgi:hypothetical protein